MGREDSASGTAGVGLECHGKRGSTSTVSFEREKEVVLAQVHAVVGERRCQPNCLDLNPNSTIYCSIPCGSDLNPLGLSFFSM